MFQLITEKIDEFVGSYGVQPTAGTGEMTATQIVEQQKQSMKMLGLSVLACIRMKREMTYLRIWNVFEHYLDPVGKTPDVVTGKLKDKYRSFTISEATLEEGKSGKKIIAFTDEEPSDEVKQSMFQAEKESDKSGESVRFHLLHVEQLKNFPLTWYVSVNPQERQSGALDRVLFSDQLNQGSAVTQITGRQMNADKLIDNFESTWKAKGLFERENVEMPVPGGDVKAQGEGLLNKIKGMQGGPAPVPASPMTPPAATLAQAA